MGVWGKKVQHQAGELLLTRAGGVRFYPQVWQLKICCPFAAQGCAWTGTLGQDDRVVDEHLKTCVSAAFEPCKACGLWVQQADQLAHGTTECPLRLVRCSHCEEEMPARILKAHKLLGGNLESDLCENRTRCPFSACQVTMPHAELERHMLTACQARRVVCTGCSPPHILPLCDLSAHLATLAPEALARQAQQAARQLYAQG
jgi:hypothetical protein